LTKIKIVCTNQKSNLWDSCQSDFSLFWHPPTTSQRTGYVVFQCLCFIILHLDNKTSNGLGWVDYKLKMLINSQVGRGLKYNSTLIEPELYLENAVCTKQKNSTLSLYTFCAANEAGSKGAIKLVETRKHYPAHRNGIPMCYNFKNPLLLVLCSQSNWKKRSSQVG